MEPATTSTNLQKIEHQQVINLKKYKKEKALLKDLMTYISQLIVLGFNSQKYDIPLIRNYLAPSLIKFDSVPTFVIKKMGALMAISRSKLKFLDITNYLAAGISQAKFYPSYGVSTMKGYFPYSWIDSINKLQERCLPGNEAFYSLLTRKSISSQEYQSCKDVWDDEAMTTFGEYVKCYNNGDVVGFVEASGKNDCE